MTIKVVCMSLLVVSVALIATADIDVNPMIWVYGSIFDFFADGIMIVLFCLTNELEEEFPVQSNLFRIDPRNLQQPISIFRKVDGHVSEHGFGERWVSQVMIVEDFPILCASSVYEIFDDETMYLIHWLHALITGDWRAEPFAFVFQFSDRAWWLKVIRLGLLIVAGVLPIVVHNEVIEAALLVSLLLRRLLTAFDYLSATIRADG